MFTTLTPSLAESSRNLAASLVDAARYLAALKEHDQAGETDEQTEANKLRMWVLARRIAECRGLAKCDAAHHPQLQPFADAADGIHKEAQRLTGWIEEEMERRRQAELSA